MGFYIGFCRRKPIQIYFSIIDLPHDWKLNRFVPLLLGNVLGKEKYGNTDPKAKQKMYAVCFFVCVCKSMTTSYKRRMEGLCVGGGVFLNVLRRIRISACFILVGTFDWSS